MLQKTQIQWDLEHNPGHSHQTSFPALNHLTQCLCHYPKPTPTLSSAFLRRNLVFPSLSSSSESLPSSRHTCPGIHSRPIQQNWQPHSLAPSYIIFPHPYPGSKVVVKWIGTPPRQRGQDDSAEVTRSHGMFRGLIDSIVRLWLKHGSQNTQLQSPLDFGVLICDAKTTKAVLSRSSGARVPAGDKLWCLCSKLFVTTAAGGDWTARPSGTRWRQGKQMSRARILIVVLTLGAWAGGLRSKPSQGK